MTDSFYITETVAAEQLGLARSTLARWRWKGEGPKYRKFGSAVRYSTKDVDEYANAREVIQ